MRISIQTLGSLGDVMPYIALALALKARGNDVAILAPRDFSDQIERYGIEVSQTPAFSLGSWMAEAGERGTLGNPVSFFRDWSDMIAPHIDDTMAHCLAAGDGADVIVANLICAPARIAAEAHNCPIILTAQQSVLSPTREEPCAMMWRPWHGRSFHRAGYALVNLSNRIIGQRLKQHRNKLGVGPQPAFSDLGTHLGVPLQKVTSVPWPIMTAAPKDWSKTDHLTAYPSLPPSDKTQLSPKTRAFLEAGEGPVYIGLGSLSAEHGASLMQVALGGLEAAGLRGIISGDLAKDGVEGPDSVLFVAHEPHDLLFPKCKAVVHHGGAGTSDTALRAGVPQIIQPHFLDQFWYADKLERLGLAPKALPIKNLTSGRLAAALNLATASDMRLQAWKIGAEARSRNGAKELAELILQLAQPCA